MKRRFILFFAMLSCTVAGRTQAVTNDTLVYHVIRTDVGGKIVPWYGDDPGEAYDTVINLVWRFWKNMETDSNGQRYYLNHQVWSAQHDKRGLGGDQLMMALSSWDLLYNYTGDTAVLANMKYIADYYLEHSLSSPDAKWPNLPYPYNMNVESGIYDGDMILGKGFLQPDKGGSLGYELVHLFKKTGNKKYLDAAIAIANTLAEKVRPGDEDHSPWPFKVNAITGDTGVLIDQEAWYEGMDKDVAHKQAQKKSTYTTFWTASLGLFDELASMNQGNTAAYKRASQLVFNWLMKFPALNNKWGPFFEDVPRWSDTQINATTFAMYLLEHRQRSSNWKNTAGNIIAWVYSQLGNKQYSKYGVTCINEQTAYPVPGNSHTARQASVDLLYAEKTGDTSLTGNAVRQLNWATYMVDNDGKNFYPTNAIWMTDGYGDYVRHYIRAMAAAPWLAPSTKDVMLRSSSIVTDIKYANDKIMYKTYDGRSTETLRLNKKPSRISGADGWSWRELSRGGVLTVFHKKSNSIVIYK